MSGIEVAGLVLGAFPVAIEVIKYLLKAMQIIKETRNYQQILRQFARELTTERCKYENTCIELLSEVVHAAQLKRMMANPGSQEWNDMQFKQKLRERLRPAEKTLEIWVDAATELHETLQNVSQHLTSVKGEFNKVNTPLNLRPTRINLHFAIKPLTTVSANLETTFLL